jgi:hypothetical protein
MLATLTDKSLLRVTQTGRYEMHELVRQYAAARLEETAAEGDRVRDRHCDYYAAFLAQRERDLKGAELLRALAEIRPEIDNIRVMWRWAVARGRWDAVAECLDSLGFIFQNRAMWHEAADTFGMATNALGDEPSVLLGRLLLWQGHIGASVYGALSKCHWFPGRILLSLAVGSDILSAATSCGRQNEPLLLLRDILGGMVLGLTWAARLRPVAARSEPTFNRWPTQCSCGK